MLFALQHLRARDDEKHRMHDVAEQRRYRSSGKSAVKQDDREFDQARSCWVEAVYSYDKLALHWNVLELYIPEMAIHIVPLHD